MPVSHSVIHPHGAWAVEKVKKHGLTAACCGCTIVLLQFQ